MNKVKVVFQKMSNKYLNIEFLKFVEYVSLITLICIDKCNQITEIVTKLGTKYVMSVHMSKFTRLSFQIHLILKVEQSIAKVLTNTNAKGPIK